MNKNEQPPTITTEALPVNTEVIEQIKEALKDDSAKLAAFLALLAEMDAAQARAEQYNLMIIDLREQITSLESEVDTANSVIEEITQKVEDIQSQAGPTLPVVSVRGIRYAFTIPRFKHESRAEAYTAEEAAEDNELLETLVDQKFGGLRKL